MPIALLERLSQAIIVSSGQSGRSVRTYGTAADHKSQHPEFANCEVIRTLITPLCNSAPTLGATCSHLLLVLLGIGTLGTFTSLRSAPMIGRGSYSAAEAAALSLASAALAAFGTYVVTGYLESKKAEKARALRRAELNADRALSKKRQDDGGSPKGTLIQDVRIDEIYLWEVQHLGEFFSSEAAGVVNHMHGVGSYQKYTDDSTGYFSKLSLSTHSADDESDPKKTHYNKLIGSHECILSDLVRKPGAPGVVQKTTAYCRAGVSSGFSNLGYFGSSDRHTLMI